MRNSGPVFSSFGIDRQGIETTGTVYWNLAPVRLFEEAIIRREGQVTVDGPLVTLTGEHTGRAANDKFIVREGDSGDKIWWGKVNAEISPGAFRALREKIYGHFAERDLFVFDGYAGADPTYQMPVRVVSELAWHSMFARNMFVRETDPEVLAGHEPGFTVLAAPNVKADPGIHGTNSDTFIIVSMDERMAIIGGSAYAGEIKKSIFSVMNYRLPERGVLSMHCSANYGAGRDDVALFFGLSGTGKTTLSAEPSRTLIGDDEHGWSDDGVFNIEGGCYAKVIRLSPEGEPEIYATTKQFGTIMENVVVDPDTRKTDLDDARHTENTRASYPMEQLENADVGGVAGHPRAVIFLTCDAFGVLPPLSRLDEAQAMYHFLSGYTAKVAGTEEGVTEPSATFSACFGAPFMPLHPGRYAELLGEKIRKHQTPVWLINTGWSGGPFGIGSRIPLAHTRRMVDAALSGELEGAEMRQDPLFGLSVPTEVEGVPSALLDPRGTWDDKVAYDERAAKLADMFEENFANYADGVTAEIAAAGPRVAQSAV